MSVLLQFRRGTWILDKELVTNFIARLEKCIAASDAIATDAGAVNLLEFVKGKQMYNNNQQHMLEGIEYQVESAGKNWDDLIF